MIAVLLNDQCLLWCGNDVVDAHVAGLVVVGIVSGRDGVESVGVDVSLPTPRLRVCFGIPLRCNRTDSDQIKTIVKPIKTV